MSDSNTTLELILKLRTEGKFEEATAELEKLKKQAEEVSEAGFKAGEALEKLSTSGPRAPLTNTGAGLASDPNAFLAQAEAAQQKNIQLTRDQVAGVEQLEARLKNLITALRLKGEAHEKESALLQRSTAALAPHRAEQERQSKVLEELKKNQASESEEVDKATGKKKELTQVVQGLAAAHAGPLGTALRGLTTAWGAATAGVALLIKGLIDYARTLHEAREKQDALAGSSSELGQAMLNALDIKQMATIAAESFEKIERGVDGARARMNEWNAELLLNERLQKKLDDAELRNQLERIKTDKNLSPTQKLQAEADANRAAEARKRQSEEDTLRSEAVNASMAAANAQLASDRAAGQLPGLRDQLKARKDLEKETSGSAGRAETEGQPEIKRLREDLKTLQRIKAGSIAPLDLKEFAEMSAGGKTGDELQQQFQEQLDFWTKFITDSKIVAEQAKQKREQLERQYNETLAERNRAASEAIALDKEARSKTAQLDKTIENNRRTEPIEADTNKRKTDAAIEAETERERRDARTFIERVRKFNEHGGEGEPPERPESLRGLAYPQIRDLSKPTAAIEQNTDATQGLADAIVEGMSAQNELMASTVSAVGNLTRRVEELQARINAGMPA